MGRERLARYSLAGTENRAAVEAGLAGGDWFRSHVPRKRMKELMRRSDYPAIRDTAIWIGLILLFAGLGIALWGTWWALPCFLAYGTLYGSTSDSRWHETGHGTAFKTRWLDEGLYQIASFMIMRDPTVWRWSHARHHTDTLILGRDPEIAAMRPARLVRLLANFVGLVDVTTAFRMVFLHASGRLSADEADFVPEPERHKVYRTARIDLAIYAATVASAIVLRSWLPVVLIGDIADQAMQTRPLVTRSGIIRHGPSFRSGARHSRRGWRLISRAGAHLAPGEHHACALASLST